MTETNIKLVEGEENTYEVLLRSDEVDCQVKAMALVSKLNTVPRTEINREDHVLITIKTDEPRGRIKQILNELTT